MKQITKKMVAFLLAFVLVAMNFTGLEVKAAADISTKAVREVAEEGVDETFTKADFKELLDGAEIYLTYLDEKDYTKESWEYLENCYERAKKVYKDSTSTEEEYFIEAMYLTAAMVYMEPIVTIKFSTSNYSYDGKRHKPTVTVKDRQGKVIDPAFYDVEYESGRTEIGRYPVAVVFNGENGRHVGIKETYFEIGPKNPTTVTTSLYGHDDVKVSWSKVSDVSGYEVWYRKSTSNSYTYLGRTTGTSYKKSNLTDGAKYYFKVVPYKVIDGKRCQGAGKSSYIYTLKKLSTPSVSRYGTKVKVKWSNISGESGYQISRSSSKTGTYIVSTYPTTKGTYRYVSATKGKYYYYKVRAYRQVGDTKVYGPWSNTVRYRR